MWVHNKGKAHIHYHFGGVKKDLPLGPPVELPDNEGKIVLGKFAKLGVVEVSEPQQVKKVSETSVPQPEPPKPKAKKKKAAKKKG